MKTITKNALFMGMIAVGMSLGLSQITFAQDGQDGSISTQTDNSDSSSSDSSSSNSTDANQGHHHHHRHHHGDKFKEKMAFHFGVCVGQELAKDNVILTPPAPGQQKVPPTPAQKDAFKKAAATCKAQFEANHHHKPAPSPTATPTTPTTPAAPAAPAASSGAN